MAISVLLKIIRNCKTLLILTFNLTKPQTCDNHAAPISYPQDIHRNLT